MRDCTTVEARDFGNTEESEDFWMEVEMGLVFFGDL